MPDLARSSGHYITPLGGYGFSAPVDEPPPLLLLPAPELAPELAPPLLLPLLLRPLLGLLLRPLLPGALLPLDRRSGAAAGRSGAGASLLVGRSAAGRCSGAGRRSGLGRRPGVARTSGSVVVVLLLSGLLLGDRSTRGVVVSGLVVASGCARSGSIASDGVVRSPGAADCSGEGIAEGEAIGDGLMGRSIGVVGWRRMAAALSSWGWLRICCNTRSGMLGSEASSSCSEVLETGQPSRGGKDCSPPNQLAIGGGVTRIPKILTSPERSRATEPAPRVEAKVAVTKNNGAIQRLRWG